MTAQVRPLSSFGLPKPASVKRGSVTVIRWLGLSSIAWSASRMVGPAPQPPRRRALRCRVRAAAPRGHRRDRARGRACPIRTPFCAWLVASWLSSRFERTVRAPAPRRSCISQASGDWEPPVRRAFRNLADPALGNRARPVRAGRDQLHEERPVPLERERDGRAVVSPSTAIRREHPLRRAPSGTDRGSLRRPRREVGSCPGSRAPCAHGRHQHDALARARATADQRRIGRLDQVLEPGLEAVELPGDAELRVDRVRIDPCLASLSNELRRRRDVLEVRQLCATASSFSLRCTASWAGAAPLARRRERLVFLSAPARRVEGEQRGTKENCFAQHRFGSRPVIGVDPNVLVTEVAGPIMTKAAAAPDRDA